MADSPCPANQAVVLDESCSFSSSSVFFLSVIPSIEEVWRALAAQGLSLQAVTFTWYAHKHTHRHTHSLPLSLSLSDTQTHTG